MPLASKERVEGVSRLCRDSARRLVGFGRDFGAIRRAWRVDWSVSARRW